VILSVFLFLAQSKTVPPFPYGYMDLVGRFSILEALEFQGNSTKPLRLFLDGKYKECIELSTVEMKKNRASTPHIKLILDCYRAQGKYEQGIGSFRYSLGGTSRSDLADPQKLIGARYLKSLIRKTALTLRKEEPKELHSILIDTSYWSNSIPSTRTEALGKFLYAMGANDPDMLNITLGTYSKYPQLAVFWEVAANEYTGAYPPDFNSDKAKAKSIAIETIRRFPKYPFTYFLLSGIVKRTDPKYAQQLLDKWFALTKDRAFPEVMNQSVKKRQEEISRNLKGIK
jgi:hypothetical protein